MKILLVCHRFPFPAEGGGKIRALKIIEYLGKKHELHVFSMVRGPDESKGIPELARLCSSVTAPSIGRLELLFSLLASFIKGRSLSEGYFMPRTVRRAMLKVLHSENFGLTLAHSSSVGPLVESLGIPKIFDFCDMDSRKWEIFGTQSGVVRKFIYGREEKKVRKLEQRLAHRADAVSVATPEEHRALMEIAPKTQFPFWFSNGVDIEYFRPLRSPCKTNQLCFIGRMDYLPNIDCVEWFVLQCWEKIRQQHPEAQFLIIGANPASRVLALEKYSGVRVTGTVDDVRPFLGISVAMVAPLRIARGIQNKILESLAMGVPVVTSGLCIDALSPAVSRSVVRADSAGEVVAACLQMIGDPMARRRLAVQGRRAVRLEATWPANLRVLDKVIDTLTQVNRPRV